MSHFGKAFAGVALLMAGCATPYWPGDATVDGENWSDTTIVKRYDQASTKKPGTDQNLRGIKRALLEKDSGAKIIEIRWISSTKAIANVELHNPTYAAFFYALEKGAKGWRLVTTYLGAVE